MQGDVGVYRDWVQSRAEVPEVPEHGAHAAQGPHGLCGTACARQAHSVQFASIVCGNFLYFYHDPLCTRDEQLGASSRSLVHSDLGKHEIFFARILGTHR